MITKENFGPIQVVANPDFPLHDLCTMLPNTNDVDFEQMIVITKKIGGIHNEPATVWNDMLLDGRNRQEVCKKVGCPMEYRVFTGTYPQARDYVIAKNMARRHMQPSQRAMFVANLASVDERNGYGAGRKREDIAAKAHVSPDLAAKAIKIRKEAGEKAVERVLSGKTTLSKEMKELESKNKVLGISDREALGSDIRRRDRIDASDDLYVDGNGKVVPPSLQEVWRDSGNFDKLRLQLEIQILVLKKIIASTAGYAVSDNYRQSMQDLINDLLQKRPHFICPHCSGGKKCSCSLCNKKWLARGKEACDICYCCDGHGFILKDEPFPEVEWHKGV